MNGKTLNRIKIHFGQEASRSHFILIDPRDLTLQVCLGRHVVNELHIPWSPETLIGAVLSSLVTFPQVLLVVL